jgi:molybdenum cofactor biosynthesis enzyme
MSKLTHINDKGQAHMVDVSGKGPTERTAMAEAIVRMRPDTLAMVLEGSVRRHHGRQEDIGSHSAVSPIADCRRDGAVRTG